MRMGDVCRYFLPNALSYVIKHYKSEVGMFIKLYQIDPPIIDGAKHDMLFDRSKDPSDNKMKDTIMKIRGKEEETHRNPRGRGVGGPSSVASIGLERG
ncbi:hypothetical protein J1N35_019191 [Gossypium stocksii]|uniref:Uncharacterized protein n=1 Tax=Gossypium stocksii TaxID=47602 RepID=A0A9D3VQG6_9ROSI|nr:hypothetical protein J1N35_019191 [Gossypium stocksii]